MLEQGLPMALSDELAKLQDLHQRGALTDDEFSRAKARVLDGAASSAEPPAAAAVTAVNSLRRSVSDRWISGVCGGIARATGVESWVWGLLFVLLLLCGGAGFVLYVLLWIFVPSD